MMLMKSEISIEMVFMRFFLCYQLIKKYLYIRVLGSTVTISIKEKHVLCNYRSIACGIEQLQKTPNCSKVTLVLTE